MRAVALAFAAVLAGCGDDGGGPDRPNVLLVTIDTLRADHLEPYGYGRATSPRIAELASRSVVFDEAVAPSSWTLPSLASIMTSLPPSTHRATEIASRLGSDHRTLAEILAAAGYDTYAVATHYFLDRRFGLSQGFTHFDVQLVDRLELSHLAITSERVVEKASRWIDDKSLEDDGMPWFAWLHFFDPHSVYQPHDEFAFGSELVDLYDGEIAFTDRAVGRLLDRLEARGLADDTIVVVVADHGEEFGDHGATGHGHTLHRELVRVPMVVHVPGTAPARVEQPVGAVDLVPTLLELVGVECEERFAGRSLVPLLDGGTLAPRPVLSEVELPNGRELASLVTDRWKLVHDFLDETSRLYDREHDVEETADVSASHQDVVEDLLGVVTTLRAEAEVRAIADGPGEALEVDEMRALRLLGYAAEEEVPGR
ncbi:MAG: sulfatase [Planctomycetota bacterium]